MLGEFFVKSNRIKKQDENSSCLDIFLYLTFIYLIPAARFKNCVIIRALVILLINPPITGTTKNASFENLYFLQTVCIVVN